MAFLMTPALLTPAAFYFLPEPAPEWYCALIKVALTVNVRLRRLNVGQDPGCCDLIIVPARVMHDGQRLACEDDWDPYEVVDLRRCLSVRNYFLCYSPGYATASDPLKVHRLGLVIVSSLACFLRACSSTAEMLSRSAAEYILQLGLRARARNLIHELRNRADQQLLNEATACIEEARKARLVGGSGPITAKEELVATLQAIVTSVGQA
jgi:hypothetical protein